MPGTNNQNGRDLTGLAHLRQSVRDILTTPIGTRVMRREYGSRLFELLDAPLTPGTLTRLRVDRIKATAAQGRLDGGKVLIDLEGVYLPDGEAVRIEGIVV